MRGGANDQSDTPDSAWHISGSSPSNGGTAPHPPAGTFSP